MHPDKPKDPRRSLGLTTTRHPLVETLPDDDAELGEIRTVRPLDVSDEDDTGGDPYNYTGRFSVDRD